MEKNKDEIHLRDYRQNDEEQIAYLFFNNFPETLAPEKICETWLWQFKNTFSKDSGVGLAELDDEVVAHYAVMCFPLSYKGSHISGAISTATVTDKKARGKGLFTKLARKVFSDIGADGCKLVFGFPNSQSIKGFIEKLDWFEIAKFPLLIKPVNFYPFLYKKFENRPLSSLFAFFMNIGHRAVVNLTKGWGQDRSLRLVTDIKEFPEGVSNLWETSFASGKIALVREATYLKWRYIDKPFDKYDVVIAVNEKNKLIGYMITKVVEKKGLNVVYVMEIMAQGDDQKVYRKFLNYLDSYARSIMADAMSILCLPNNPNKGVFYKQGFFPVPRKLFPQDIYFCARINSADINKEYVKNPDNWFITWGDLDIV